VLERRTVQIDGAAGPWAELPLAHPADGYIDSDLREWTDGAAYEYRLAVARGTERSEAISATGPAAALLAPVFDGSATIDTGGIRLSFHSTSHYATEIALSMLPSASDWQEVEVAVVPASATSHDDVVSPPGVHRYRAIARRRGRMGQLVTSDSAVLDGMSAPPLSWGVVTSRATTSVGVVAARAPSGAFATATLNNYAFGAPTLIAPSGESGSTLQPVEGAVLFLPGVVMDRAGHPHAVLADGPEGPVHPWQDPVDIVHVWHDGAAWQRELIARRVISPGDATQIVRFDMGPDGTLHASWQTQTSSSYPIEVASRTDAGWTISDATAALPAGCANGGQPGSVARCVNHFVVGDAHGAAHLVVVGWDYTLAHVWSTNGRWSSEAIPTAGGVSVLWGDFEVFRVLGGGDGPAIVYQRGEIEGDGPVFAMVRETTGWSAPAVVSNSFYGGGWDAARSPDGARIAVATAGEVGHLWIREADGSVVEKRWFSAGGDFAVGFGLDGKAWVASGLASYTSTGSVPIIVFDER
jgi:hypothetical protein